jgi:hypothetical protein
VFLGGLLSVLEQNVTKLRGELKLTESEGF